MSRQISEDGRWEWDPDRNEWVPRQVGPPSGPPPQPSPPPKRSHRRRIFALLGLGVAVLLIFGVCLAAANGGGTKPSPSSAPAAQTTPTKAPAAAAAKTPDPAGTCAPQPCANDSYGWIVNVSDVKYDAPAGQFDQHEQGNVFVTMNVTFANKLKNEQHANPTEFVLKDGNGIKHTLTNAQTCPMWSPVNLTAGATFGPKCLVFEAAAGKPTGLVLTWTPHLTGDYNIKLS